MFYILSRVCVIKTDKDAHLELVYRIFPTPRKNKDSWTGCCEEENQIYASRDLCRPVWGSWHTAGPSYWTPWRPGKTESKCHTASFSYGPALSPQKTELLHAQNREHAKVTCNSDFSTPAATFMCAIITWCHPFNKTTHDLHTCNQSICLTHRVWRKQHWWCTGWRLVWWRNETSPSSPLDCSLLVCWMKQKTEALNCGIEGNSCVEQGDLIITGGKNNQQWLGKKLLFRAATNFSAW